MFGTTPGQSTKVPGIIEHLTVELVASHSDMCDPGGVRTVSPTVGIQAGPVSAGGSTRYQLRVDSSEQQAELFGLLRQCADFEVRVEHLTVGDYVVDGGVTIERKTYGDFAVSLADGRLFTQAAALAQCPHRPVILLEGPRPSRMPHVHPHALKGAAVSLAVMWRLPVIYARDPQDSLRILRFLARQLGETEHGILKRYDRKPKRLTSRRLYMLQGLPGVGPALAQRLLLQFGSVERVVTATEATLLKVRGVQVVITPTRRKQGEMSVVVAA